MNQKSQSLQTGLLQKPLIPIAHLYHAPTHTTLAVFTYEEAPEDPVWATFPVFRWHISEKCDYFFKLIKERLWSIENYDSSLNNERKIYKDE